MKHKPKTMYLHEIFSPERRQCVISSMEIRLTEMMMEHPYDAIAFCGVSGAGVAFSLSDRLGVPLINVRKEDSSHYIQRWDATEKTRYLEGALWAESYVIVDDFIDSGSTVKRMLNLMEGLNPSAKCCGIVLYRGHYYRDHFVYYSVDERKIELPVYYGGGTSDE